MQLKRDIPVLLAILCVIATVTANEGINEIKVEENKEPEEIATEELVQPETIDYSTPLLEKEKLQNFFYEHFDEETAYENKWLLSKSTKSDSQDLKYDGEWKLIESNPRLKGDNSLLLINKARHHAIGAKLKEIFNFKKEKNLVLQYEVQFRNGQECGGAYIKLLASPSGELNAINDKSPYTIMFGPDKCGNDHKLHFIFIHRNPKTGSLREIHWRSATAVSKLEDIFKDGKWHLFRLVLRSDNTFEIQMDKRVVGKGSLFEEFNPSVNPPKEIDDLSDEKPEDWDEREKIPDPEASKPEEWNENEPRKIVDPTAFKPSDWNEEEPEMVPDPEASKPSDWDPEMDGEWEAPLISNPKCAGISGCGTWTTPLIDNPKYRGKWKPPLISNPNYKGKWAPRKIPNPDFFDDNNPFMMQSIDSLAFELWTISDEIAFDNILLTNDVNVANYVLDRTFQIKKDLVDSESDSLFLKLIKYTNKKPWLWAVYVLVIALPVVLFISFCCVQPIKNTSQSKQKIDEVTPDTFEEPQDPNILTGEGVEPLIVQESKPIEKQVDQVQEKEDSEEEEIDSENDGEVGEETPNEDEEDLDEKSKEPIVRTSPRLRKLRAKNSK